ncbi:hypothetical protein ACP6C7_18875 [Mycolicibacterium septicum]|uniref:Lipoprotein n=1 Tax=Mycolicibacterium septicum TaxID=98668 RepID=A0ABW9LS15_9MYCO
MRTNVTPARIVAGAGLGLLLVFTFASLCSSPEKPPPPPPPVTVTQTVTTQAPPPPPPPPTTAPPATGGTTIEPDWDRPHVDGPNIHRPHKPGICRHTRWC